MIKIAYVSFWTDPDNDSWLTHFINENIGKTNIVKINENPDILITSCMGQLSTFNTVKNTNANIKILYYGENLVRYPPFDDINKIKDVFDLIIGFKYTDIQNKIIRFPLWFLYYPFYTFNENDNILTYIEKQRIQNKQEQNKNIFATLIARHDREGQRTILYNECQKYGQIICASDFKNNYKKLLPGYKNKLDLISKSWFNICPENSMFEGYFTEKIFHAFEAGCIPIYWGISNPENNIFNNKSYCFINNINNKNEVNLKIKECIEHKTEYLKQNIFKNNAKYVIADYYNILKWQIKLKLNLIEKQKIYGISYVSRNFNNRYNSMTNMGKTCGYFDNFVCLKEDFIDDWFKQKYVNVWNNSRGGGYWIWKPFIIFKKLQEINENDILIYIDGGCNICTTTDAQNRFNDYVNMVNNNWTGHLRFQLEHKEFKYTNKHLIQYFNSNNKLNINYNDVNYNDVNINEIINTEQLVGGIQVIRKNKFTMDFFTYCMKIIDDDVELFTDKYNLKTGEQHRHDQSVMSMLYKIMGGDLIIKDETYFGVGGNFNSEISNKYPFWATRLRN